MTDCPKCGQELTPNSAAVGGWGEERWYCFNDSCEEGYYTRKPPFGGPYR